VEYIYTQSVSARKEIVSIIDKIGAELFIELVEKGKKKEETKDGGKKKIN
jgi:hypothetical protein